MKPIEQIAKEVGEWGKAKGLNSADRQLLKAMEELGELVNAHIKSKLRKEVMDGVGDAVIPLMGFCRIVGIDFAECVNYAWSQVSGRTGVVVNGSFIKDAGQDKMPDLPANEADKARPQEVPSDGSF